jgi:hypothetical protein
MHDLYIHFPCLQGVVVSIDSFTFYKLKLGREEEKIKAKQGEASSDDLTIVVSHGIVILLT